MTPESSVPVAGVRQLPWHPSVVGDFVLSGVTGSHTGKMYRGGDEDKDGTNSTPAPHLSLTLRHSLLLSLGVSE